MPDAPIYLIWSHEHGAWWRPDSAGYTQQWDKAGTHSREEALVICAGQWAGRSGRSLCPAEMPVRLEDAQACDAAYQNLVSTIT